MSETRPSQRELTWQTGVMAVRQQRDQPSHCRVTGLRRYRKLWRLNSGPLQHAVLTASSASGQRLLHAH